MMILLCSHPFAREDARVLFYADTFRCAVVYLLRATVIYVSENSQTFVFRAS